MLQPTVRAVKLLECWSCKVIVIHAFQPCVRCEQPTEGTQKWKKSERKTEILEVPQEQLIRVNYQPI
jgi:hypothetical protein